MALYWDPPSGLPLTHLQHILDLFMPTWQSEMADTVAILKQIQEKCQEQADLNSNTNQTLHCIGSYVDNFNIPAYLKREQGRWPTDPLKIGDGVIMPDFDLMMVTIGKVTCNPDTTSTFVIETEHTHPGYLRLRLCHPMYRDYYTLRRNGYSYQSSALMGKWRYLSMLSTKNHDPDASSQDMSGHGPALTIRSKGVQLDCVNAWHCPDWPEQALEWISRERPSGWPSESMRNEIVQAGFYVVPVAHKQSEWPEAGWRFSFTLAESKLCRTLTEDQRRCYILLKLLVKFELDPTGLVSSYCLKNLLFRSLEKIPQEQWEDQDNALATNFLLLLDELKSAFIKRELQHYFIQDNNLFGDITEDFAKDLVAKVSKIRQNPVEPLLAFDKVYMFRHSPLRKTLSEVVNPVLNHCREHNFTKEEATKIHIKSFKDLLSTYMQGDQFEAALFTCKKLSQLVQQIDGKNFDTVMHLQDLAVRLLPPQNALQVFQFLEDRFPDAPAAFFGNKGRVLTSLYATTQDLQSEYQKEADQTFQKALSKQNQHGASTIDYVVFLRKCGRSEDAIPLLHKVLVDQGNDARSRQTYVIYSSVDEDIQVEIDTSEVNSICTTSLTWAYYNLARCYLETSKTSDARELMVDFRAACETDAVAYSLLGHTYKALGDNKAAREAYKCALEIKPDYSLCEALVRSLMSLED